MFRALKILLLRNRNYHANIYKKPLYEGGMPAKLPDLSAIVDSVVRDYLARRNYPQRLSTEEVRQQLHIAVHEKYFLPGRAIPLHRHELKRTVRACLEKSYQRIEECESNPLKLGRTMITGAYYEKK